MKTSPRTLKSLAVLAAAGLALTACSSGGSDADPSEGGETGLSLVSEGQLTVCSEIPYEPFEFTDENGDIVGFDMDIATEIAADLGLEREIIADSFESIQSGLSFGKCDISISSISITEERKGNMDFSDPYMADDLTLIAASGSDVTDLDSAKDKKVGVQDGTTGKKYAEENGISPVGFESTGLLLQALKSGTVDAALGNASVLGYGIKDEADISRVEDFATGEELGVSIEKGDAAMLEAVNGTLQRLTDSGEMDELKAKWFGETE
ncbi:substrate-binding periplasmic protein [Zhihengliuella halotolerans]|uniref:Amino acid ABC transporter substrate-binding protein (PAAT family) n=1 Tax=Zhihengliuella halotolerans TaxID=370736 RepID=A0A4Q8AAI6_9MICC|nr:ABC transporter substrate-binding protein [Zhihengliuella halotolerans]RZU60671.1 amino acid ABC transporter substrate-binding protein (PAAT family) [Zhihengliuella halotolerans]